MTDLQGKNALVTGATRGIGEASARALDAAGARVVLSGRTTSMIRRCPSRPLAALAVVLLSIACARDASLPDPGTSVAPTGEGMGVGHTATEAMTPDGRFISWREHIIDDPERAGFPLSGSDGLQMADLDLDGHPDIVSVHERDTTYDGVPEGWVRIAWGSADPLDWELSTLAEKQEAAAAEDASIADVDGDGYPDIVVACELAHLIYFQNPGAGARTGHWQRLRIPVTLDRGSFIRVFLADFDGDGTPEAVAPNKGVQNPARDTATKHPVSIFWLDGDPLDGGAWQEQELGRYIDPRNSEPVDVDGDGDLDIVAGSTGESRLVWFENLALASPAPGERFAFREHRIDIEGGRSSGFNMDYADLDGDGRLDIVTQVDNDLGWLEQPAVAGGRWTAHTIGTFVPDSMTGLTLVDIDGDGDLDAMAGSYSRGPRDRDDENLTVDSRLGRIGWFEQGDDPRAEWTRHDVSRRIRGMFDQFVAHDMDGDGDVDFAGTRGNSSPYDGVYWLEQIRSDEPRPSFERARDEDSREIPLPGP